MNKKPLPITGSGEETRDFTYVDDIINAVVAMAYYEEAIGEAINVGTGKEIRIIDLAKWINQITGNPAGITYKESRNWDKKIRLLSSIEKAKQILCYNPKVEFKDGLNSIYQWFTGNWENIQKSAEF
jgi:nucleoside-diphosphate-sugar epimerase